VPPYLNADEVAELAALLVDAPRRVGLVARVLDAAERGRGLDLRTDGVHSILQGLSQFPGNPDENPSGVARKRAQWRRLLS
jgi:hypothetical protein